MNEYDLTAQQWTLTSYLPWEYQTGPCAEVGAMPKPDSGPVPVTVPGSVQAALRDAGIIPDWNYGLNSRQCEWIENRHWNFEVRMPADSFDPNKQYRLVLEGLDHAGQIMLDGQTIYEFDNAHVPHTVALNGLGGRAEHTLSILFYCPPRWLGQFGWTSRCRDFKPRFYYGWDWTSRVVQVGITGPVYIEEVPPVELIGIITRPHLDLETRTGSLTIGCKINHNDAETDPAAFSVNLALTDPDTNKTVHEQTLTIPEFASEKSINIADLQVLPWWPNRMGPQKLYDFSITVKDPAGNPIQAVKRTLGFKNIRFEHAPGRENADPWVCHVNGSEVFLCGVNWTPIRPNTADVSQADYVQRLETYKDLKMNLLRVWGGASIEKQTFYDQCDRLGLLVWQEFPLCSSGFENLPPDDDEYISRFGEIVTSYIHRLHYHPSLLLYSGGNELTDTKAVPLTEATHPILKRTGDIIRQLDPGTRFVPTSPSGPSFMADPEKYGQNQHWDIHGPWKHKGTLDDAFLRYWKNDDSLFRSEMGAPGPSPVGLIEKYAGNAPILPISVQNPLWSRTGWWLELEHYIAENGSEPETLAQYVAWGGKRQEDILAIAVSNCIRRFPECGGFLLWMGHDSFPCTANTSIIDFDGNLKPAAVKIKELLESIDHSI